MEAEIFYSFHYVENSFLSPKESYAEYLINCIKDKILPTPIEIPSVAMLAKHINYSTYMVNKALIIMSEKGYLVIKNGKKSVATDPHSDPSSYIKPEVHFHGNHHCTRNFGITSRLHTNFQKDKAYNLQISPPGQQNAICEPFLSVLSNRLNAQHQKMVTRDNMYYTHSFYALIAAVASTLKLKNQVVIVPETGYELVVCVLHARGIKVKRVAVYHNGYHTAALQQTFDEFNVGAVITLTNGNYPFAADTPKDKIRVLLNRYKQARFYIIEINLEGPSQFSKANLLLELAGEALDDILYIWQPSYFNFDSCQICAVTASVTKIRNIRNYMIETGKNAVESIAYATGEMFKHRSFPQVESEMDKERLRFKAIVIDVFGSPGFWKMEGITGDSQDSICLIPLKGVIPPDFFIRLKSIGIISVDPIKYTKKDKIDKVCIRFEMAYYVENRNCRKLLMWVNLNCMNLVTGAALVLL